MPEQIENRNLIEVTPLTPPRTVKAKFPRSAAATQLVLDTRRAIRAIIRGEDAERLLVVVGPCSIHDPAAAVEYAERLAQLVETTRDALVVVMRTYFEKPRTTVGWKGLINDPRLDGSCDIPAGLELARELLLRINDMGVPCGTEMLDPITPQYVADLVSWAAIGARTTESQTHREMASGLSMPIGFKNGTDGSLDIALNAMISARHPHRFLGINPEGVTCMISTRGNADRHIVLRGGAGRPNYDVSDVERAVKLVAGEALARPVMVDCSHDNSAKDYTRQPQVCRAVLEQFEAGQQAIMGLLIESNLHPGKQTWKEHAALAYGVSITDACIGWEDTADLLHAAAATVRRRRAARAAVAPVLDQAAM